MRPCLLQLLVLGTFFFFFCACPFTLPGRTLLRVRFHAFFGLKFFAFVLALSRSRNSLIFELVFSHSLNFCARSFTLLDFLARNFALISICIYAARTEQPGKNSQDWTARTGQPGCDSQDGTAKTGQPEPDSLNGTSRMGQPKWDIQNGTSRMG